MSEDQEDIEEDGEAIEDSDVPGFFTILHRITEHELNGVVLGCRPYLCATAEGRRQPGRRITEKMAKEDRIKFYCAKFKDLCHVCGFKIHKKRTHVCKANPLVFLGDEEP